MKTQLILALTLLLGAPLVAAADCEKILSQEFRTKITGRDSRLRIVPNTGGCTKGWHWAPGSMNPEFLRQLKLHASPKLKSALERCPIHYQSHEVTCDPCVAGVEPCRCTETWLPEKFFCVPLAAKS